VSGAFKRFDHDHFFAPDVRGTTMRDVFDYESPYGWLGRCVDGFFLRRYMVELLRRRAYIIKMAAEQTAEDTNIR
jgi:hypothetical protein